MSTDIAVQASPQSTAIGFGTSHDFEFTQRAAKALANSTLVPEAFRAVVVEKRGRDKNAKENPNAIPNCIIALNMAQRMGADPLMVMQNLYVVEGRPSWSAQFVIAAVNACGRFSPLRFDISPPGDEREVHYETVRWENGQRHAIKASCKIREQSCRAWAIEKATGERLEGPLVTMAMAEAEGWIGKNGSKWQTMAEVMLRYRSASFFGKLYAPDLLMGLQTSDEISDMVDITPAASQAATLSAIDPDLPSRPARAQFVERDDDAGADTTGNAEEEDSVAVYAVPMITGEIEEIEGADDAITALLKTADEIVKTDGRFMDWLGAAKPAIDAIHDAEGPRSDNARRLHAGIEAYRQDWEELQKRGQATAGGDAPKAGKPKSIERYKFQPLPGKGDAKSDLSAMDFAHEMREALAGAPKADREKLAQLNGGAMKRLHEEEMGLSDGLMNVMGLA